MPWAPRDSFVTQPWLVREFHAKPRQYLAERTRRAYVVFIKRHDAAPSAHGPVVPVPRARPRTRRRAPPAAAPTHPSNRGDESRHPIPHVQERIVLLTTPE